MAQETLRENKMGTMPENRLLLSMAVPMMISMLVQALYNIVDSIFVSRICEDALTAVSMAFPWQNIIISIAVGFGVGINALLSRALVVPSHRLHPLSINGSRSYSTLHTAHAPITARLVAKSAAVERDHRSGDAAEK